MGMPTWTHLEKLRNWSLLLVNWNFMYRPGELCECCPLFDDISLPFDNDDWDEDMYPSWVILLLRNDKEEEYIVQDVFASKLYRPEILSSFSFASVA